MGKRQMWRTPDTGVGSPQSEEYHNRMALGDFKRPTTGTTIQMRLSDQVKNTGLYPSQSKTEVAEEKKGQLNPDWTEWLMDWANGWTDLKPMSADSMKKWFDGMEDGTWNESDPADLPETDKDYIPRLTTNKTHKNDRIKAIGNGQVPLCVFFATKILQEVIEVFNEHQTKPSGIPE